jgi:hypothetical protein
VRARQAIEGGKARREQPEPGRKNKEKQNEKKVNGKGRAEKKEKALREIGRSHTPYITPTQRSHSPAHSSALGSGDAVGSSEMCVPRDQ